MFRLPTTAILAPNITLSQDQQISFLLVADLQSAAGPLDYKSSGSDL
jgi:hypothetical protein